MSTKNDGGPAFPRPFSGNPVFDLRNYEKEQIFSHGGMTLRAWLAGQAMIGLLANSYYARRHDENDVVADPETMAKAVCANADAVLKELEKP